MRFALLLMLVSAFGSSGIYSQDYPGAPGCLEPLPQKVADFTFTNETDLKIRLSDLKKELASRGEGAQAVIHVYGGRQSRSNEVDAEIERTKKLINISGAGLWIRDLGYRVNKSFEFFIRPLPCTQSPEGISDLRVDEVDLTDLPSRRIGMSDLMSRLVFAPEAKCAPVARAVRACFEGVEVEVFVVVDEKGSVVFSRAVSGHPLNRENAAHSAKEMRFQRFEDGGLSLRVSGTIRVVYSKPEEIVTN